MFYQELAEKLTDAATAAERKRLLAENGQFANEKLAEELRKICYAVWTNEPTKARKTARAVKSLLKANPKAEIEAIAFWIFGIADLTAGKLENSVKNLDRSAEIFRSVEQEHRAAETQVAKLYALALLGRYEDAVACGKDALKIFESYNDQLAAGKIEKNLGNLVARRDDNRQAERYYLSAHQRLSQIGDAQELTMCENSLANTYAELNDFRRAERFYQNALQNARESRMDVTEAEIEASIGNLALFRGRFADALRFLELSRQKFEQLEMPHQTAIAELEIADIYLELNLAEEAFAIYERIAETLHKLKLQGEEARARSSFGRAAALLKQTKTARRELTKSAKLYLAEKNETGAAAVKLTQAQLELETGNDQNARKIIFEAIKLLQKSENQRQKLTAEWLRGEVLRRLGEFSEAESLLKETFATAIKKEQTNLAQAAQTSLGKLFAARDDYSQAERHFKKAIEIVEKLRAPLPAEEFRMAYLADKLAPFENLAKIYLLENRIEDAFLLVEKARARSLVESLQRIENKTKSGTQDAKLTEKLNILREELNWFYSRLSRADDSEFDKLQREAAKREKQIADVMRQIESTATNTQGANRSEIGEIESDFSLRNLQEKIGKESALIEYVNFEGNLSAFVVTDEKIDFIKNLAKESEIMALIESLQFQFGAMRYGAQVLGKFADELKKRADLYLQELYEKLLRPLADLIGTRDLIVAPVGALYYVPFQALYDGKNYCLESREVAYSPSATVWFTLPNRKPLENTLLIGFADEKIPLVDREIEHLRKIYPQAKSFSGDEATFAAFVANADKFDILHLACHGQFRPENPLFSSLHLADGWITVRDICAQKLNAGLVTLSACETGLNKIFAGDEILGLARGFLSAGAGSLVMSLWTVSDEATVQLMSDFYKNLQREATVSTSLAKAQRKFIESKSHPYFWAPFISIGK